MSNTLDFPKDSNLVKMMKIKQTVSGTRRRMVTGDYNIDLTYIVENRVIVMSYPAANFKQRLYRNDAKEVSSQ